MIYLDWASTALPNIRLNRIALEKAQENFANPSSLHGLGKQSAELLEDCRQSCKESLGLGPKTKLIFSSGASESNNLVISSFIYKKNKGRILYSPLEHPSVLEPLKLLRELGYNLHCLALDKKGAIDLQKLEANLSPDCNLVCINSTHHETGKMQDLDKISALIYNYAQQNRVKIHLHFDGVQSLLRRDLKLENLEFSSISFSGHKIASLPGVGLLCLKKDIRAIYRGGGQEYFFRPGTENLAAIYSLSLALEDLRARKAKEEIPSTLLELLSKNKNCEVLPLSRRTNEETYSKFIIFLACRPIPAEVLVRDLSARSIYVSSGSACYQNTKNKQERYSKLAKLGMSKEQVSSAIRISMGPRTSKEDILNFYQNLEDILKNNPLAAEYRYT